MTTPGPPRFWLRFQVYSDGLTPYSSSAPFHPSFPSFSHLPPELRLQIWGHILLPRTILISCQDPDNATEQNFELSSRPSCRLVPALLHVNHEARTLALAHYELAFSWKIPAVLADMDLIAPSRDSIRGLVSESPKWSEPHIYFNFENDALFLLGELELYTESGFNSPMTYFLRREDTARVRRVAVAFRALRYGENGPQQIFGTLFHVVDRIKPPNGKFSICVNEADEMTHVLMGGERPLVIGENEGSGMDYATRRMGSRLRQREGDVAGLHDQLGLDDEVDSRELWERYQRQARGGSTQEDNVIQKIWRDWYRGSIVTSSLATMEFRLIREGELERHVREVG
ncbi:hypothetical protein BJ170DRAFT_635743 [Xylariales sp. AK1849]|nr:hypothetical protein BJ170DRAFT_635743 [Xylariales sp. AK1849]